MVARGRIQGSYWARAAGQNEESGLKEEESNSGGLARSEIGRSAKWRRAPLTGHAFTGPLLQIAPRMQDGA
jgi:hypothetical protein